MLDDQTIDVAPCGAAAVRVLSASGDRELDWRRVHALARWLAETADDAWSLSTIPTYDSVLVEFDLAVLKSAELVDVIKSGLTHISGNEPITGGRHFDVPVYYGGEDGPDLGYVAELEEMSVPELIAAHTAKHYIVRCYGSPSASPMMDAPDLPKPVPRLSSPRAHVPEGVVSLAGRQAVIAPASAPGGWQVIGRTPLVLLRRDQEPLVPYRPGDSIRFYQIDEHEYRDRLGELMVPRS
ncbi:MAG: carboxyltransferase domain-containing protein [Propionicimonas sp.]|nr:carboxyltransferase domain-containing protein [Propionicimonas sp.]MEA5054876.1 carboxyltransferase domain-containing protein [Propionicimonas sp.]